MKKNFGFTDREIKSLKKLNHPYKIQDFLNRIPYHLADTAWSPRNVFLEKTAHCLEGAIFAAAALRINGFQPLILDLEADQDTDHVIAVYQMNRAWGSIASSNYSGVRGRTPVYRSLRELALSYFEDYFNLRGDKSLRTFSKPVDLSRFDHLNWMVTEQPVWFIAEHLLEISHTALLTPAMVRNLNRVDQRTFQAGLVGHRKKK
jgi:hypothetical protein